MWGPPGTIGGHRRGRRALGKWEIGSEGDGDEATVETASVGWILEIGRMKGMKYG